MLRDEGDRWLTLSLFALYACDPVNAVQIGVISGVGVRKYYERFGYRICKEYQVSYHLSRAFYKVNVYFGRGVSRPLPCHTWT